MQMLGRYEVRGELGRGGMGVVYRAYDPTLEREVAIKSVRLDGVDEAAISQLEERLSREAKAAAKLQHPNIVAVYDFFRLEDRAYIVMEFIKGSMLEVMALSDTRAPVQRIVDILTQAAGALDFAHANGIVHRDIKPGNMLLDEHGRLKITDFGIARVTGAGATQTMSQGMGTTVGTLGYMAPEQVRGEPVDGKADQFSLGVVAYQLLTGKVPFEADTWVALSYKIIHDTPTAPTEFNPAVNKNMAAAISKAMAKKPGDRFANCTDFIAALRPGAAAVRAPGSGKKSPLLVGALALALLSAAGFWWYQDRSKVNPKTETSAVSPAAAPVAVPTAPPVSDIPADTKAEAKAETTAVAAPSIFEFVTIPAGAFFMGDDTESQDQRPRHQVRISKPFEMAKTETTEKQWNEVMSGSAKGSNLPKSGVSFNEVQGFLAKLNAKNDGYLYRLPTEAEWEYAAMAKGTTNRPRNGTDVAWYYDNAGGQKHPVGELLPNAFGLHDMLGNVCEWTSDWYNNEYYAEAPKVDPKGPATGEARVYRGGSHSAQGMVLATTWRFAEPPGTKNDEVGFRVVRVKR